MPRLVAVIALVVVAAGLGLAPSAGHANWLTHIMREAGEAGGKAATHSHPNLGPAGKALAYLEGLPGTGRGSLAAHATPEGHWQFVNREGQTFTAGTADEFKRVLPTLVPDAGEGGRLSLYLSEDSVFANRAYLDKLPTDAELHVVTDRGAFAVTRTAAEGGEKLTARLRPNLTIELQSQDGFDEAVAYLSRPLNGSNIRTVAFEPGAAKYLSSVPKFEAGTKSALVDQFDPAFVQSGLRSIKGQTIVVTGRVDGGNLIAPTSTGSTVTQDIAVLRAAARDSDVNLVILNSDAGRQPGGKNWLWQKIEVGGMNDARQRSTVGDFLDALAARRGGFALSAEHTASGRVQMSALPDPSSGGLATEASDFWSEMAGHVTGEVLTKAAEIDARDNSRQTELDGRIVPGVPTYIQIPYFLAILAGILGWSTLRGWFVRLWQPRSRSAGESRVVDVLRRLPREAVFWLGFAPVAGFPAFAVQAAVNTWATVTAPFRWFRRKFLTREV